MDFDLLTTVSSGGCSAKLHVGQLAEVLAELPRAEHPNLLVGVDTHDDAGVFKLSEEIALIQTTDFFPPVCSDPYEFGQIAAANALSDVYAMGGRPLTVLNLVMFPSNKIPTEVLVEILKGGNDKVFEAGALVVGGHTIDDYPPKFGLAVTGVVHPDSLITNAAARPGDCLILTKPVGTGALVAGQRLGEADERDYRGALENMKLLNRVAAEVMQRHGVKAATDVTGFGLVGHALGMARASDVTAVLDSRSVPVLPGALELFELGCIPGATFRNQSWAEPQCHIGDVSYDAKMLMYDAQTSGGILMAVAASTADAIVAELHQSGCPLASVVGRVVGREPKLVRIG